MATVAPIIWTASTDRTVSLGPPAIMGVLNVTPDSFSDGGAHADPGRARERALAMIDEGATIIDIGGESTRPGSTRVDADEQCRRVLPVIAALRAASPSIVLTIDTTRASVAAAALDAGADAVNDVSAGTEDCDLLPLVARRACGIVLMHRVAPPDRDQYSTAMSVPAIAGDVVRSVVEWSIQRAAGAQELGIAADRIVIDPGLGFGKTVEQNWSIIARLGEIADVGFPVLVGASRKSFIGRATNVADPAQRIIGSAVAAAVACANGATIVRAHDIRATREAIAVISALKDVAS